MSRDHTKLKVYGMADELAVSVYRATSSFPAEERYGFTSQMRRAAVSVPANIVEGCTRRSTRDYVQFLTIALGSASELDYLIDLSARLGFFTEQKAEPLASQTKPLIRSLQRLIDSLS